MKFEITMNKDDNKDKFPYIVKLIYKDKFQSHYIPRYLFICEIISLYKDFLLEVANDI